MIVVISHGQDISQSLPYYFVGNGKDENDGFFVDTAHGFDKAQMYYMLIKKPPTH